MIKLDGFRPINIKDKYYSGKSDEYLIRVDEKRVVLPKSMTKWEFFKVMLGNRNQGICKVALVKCDENEPNAIPMPKNRSRRIASKVLISTLLDFVFNERLKKGFRCIAEAHDGNVILYDLLQAKEDK